MLSLTLDKTEYFDEVSGTFFTLDERTIQLEHSLVSISKWEAIYEEPFLTATDIKGAKLLAYIRCMTITQNVPESEYARITNEHIAIINAYIQKPATATTFAEDIRGSKAKPSRRNEKYTAEVIYYWMIALGIPFECQKWHINRLLTLIKVCNIKNEPDKKMSKQETAKTFREINERNKQKYKTRG